MINFNKALTIQFIIYLIFISIGLSCESKAGSPKNKETALFTPELIVLNCDKLVDIKTSPKISYKFDLMKVGVVQHIDRDYTYDVIPDALINGLLFRGVHRTPKYTGITIELRSDATIYFFFHVKEDGGYSNIFAELDGWEKCTEFPKYDINNGDHGLNMIMYKLKAKPGIYVIPPTTKENACFNMVFQPIR